MGENMDRLTRRVPELTRERLVNPHELRFAERVRAAGALELHLNFRIEELGGGYSRMVPLGVDENLTRDSC